MSWLFCCGMVFLTLTPFSGSDQAIVRFSCGAEIELAAPALEPGGILIAKLLKSGSAKRLTIAFEGAEYGLGMANGGGAAFTLIGLDLGLKPGAHELKMTVFLQDGRTEELKHPLSVREREFPVKSLRVRQEFVTPPAEVEERIRREAELLQMVYSVTAGEWLGQGAFERPHSGQSADNFGEKRIYNGVPRSSHSGLDIAASQGSPVRAANSGRVVLARDLYFSGKTVILDHGLGVFSIYCHFSELKVSRSQAVRKGDVLAFAGSTGRSTGPHLHWAVRIRGSRVDPQSLLDLPLPE